MKKAINSIQKKVKRKDEEPFTGTSKKNPTFHKYHDVRKETVRRRFKSEQYNFTHKGQRGFIIGGGSSLLKLQEKNFDFSRLLSEITVGVNKSYSLFIPTYLVFGDAYFWRTFSPEILKISCTKIAPLNILGGLGKAKSIPNLLPVIRATGSRQDLPVSFSRPICFVNNSGVAALRIAYLLGLNPIYLLGIDIGPNAEGETHFHTAYDPQRTTHPQRYGQFLTCFKQTIQQCNQKGIEIYSCSEISLLNSYIQYCDIFTLFP